MLRRLEGWGRKQPMYGIPRFFLGLVAHRDSSKKMVPLLMPLVFGAGMVNFSTYRVTPITYPGVTNMDSGDAAGDVMFGPWYLLCVLAL